MKTLVASAEPPERGHRQMLEALRALLVKARREVIELPKMVTPPQN